jgi:hypothetical protein
VSEAPPTDQISAHAWVVLLLAAAANVLPAMNLSIMNVVYRDIQEAFPDVSAGQLCAQRTSVVSRRRLLPAAPP